MLFKLKHNKFIFLVWPGMVIVLMLAGCSGSGRGLFSSKTPHEKYVDRLSEAGLDNSVLGKLWLSAADKGLNRPLSVTLPYKETGYFSSEKPDAAGYRFSANRGDQLIVELVKKPAQSFPLFLELWEPRTGESPKLLKAADSALAGISYEIENNGEYLLRLQPELLAGGEYTLTIRTAPSLAFPVQTKSNPRIGSFWGDARDAGARKHEGIDIFSKFRTPAIAAADGIVRRVGLNNLGGKVVFLRPSGKNFTLYYAHLDSQMVQSGQRVKAGDTVGLVGNTGNAKNTPPHLHFGIYGFGGAIDPLPFVQRDRDEPDEVNAPVDNLEDTMRSKRKFNLYAAASARSAELGTWSGNTILTIKAATGNWYKVQLPDSTEGFVSSSQVESISPAIRTITLKTESPLLDRPDSLAASKLLLKEADRLSVIGEYRQYYFVKKDDATGWVLQ